MGVGKHITGGGSGIRTRDTVSRIHTFQACAFNHSATPPLFCLVDKRIHVYATSWFSKIP